MVSKEVCAFLLCLVTAGEQSQLPKLGKCPKPMTKTTLDIEQYLGVWYEIYCLPAIFEEGKCQTATYTLKDDGHIRVNNTEIVRGAKNTVIGDVFRPDQEIEGKLRVRFSTMQPYGDYWVLDTDYKTYSVVYSCGGLGDIVHFEMAWLIARTRTLDEELEQKLINVLASNNIDTQKLIKSDQIDCPE